MMASRKLITGWLNFRARYAVIGLLAGLACVGMGVLLDLKGLQGSTGWTMQAPGINSSLSHAAPGTVLIVAGLLIILLTGSAGRRSPTIAPPNKKKVQSRQSQG